MTIFVKKNHPKFGEFFHLASKMIEFMMGGYQQRMHYRTNIDLKNKKKFFTVKMLFLPKKKIDENDKQVCSVMADLLLFLYRPSY